jgi:anti-anti-sigma regulatory factor
MSDFALLVAGSGQAVNVRPQGTIDARGAEQLLEAVTTLRSDRTALLAIDLDDVEGLTDDAWRLLAAKGLPAEMMAGVADQASRVA